MTDWLAMVLGLAFVFCVTNGFLDGGGLVSIVVSTRVLEPLPALAVVAAGEIGGMMLLGHAVARTMSRQLLAVPDGTTPHVFLSVILAALLGALLWNLMMWRLAWPSSSSHALMGGLVGAGWAAYGASGIVWGGFFRIVGLLCAVPILGLIASYILSKILFRVGGYLSPTVGGLLSRCEVLVLALMAMAHGSNDGQKSLGLMVLAMGAVGIAVTPQHEFTLALICGVALAVGVIAGSNRTFQTLGRRFYRLQPALGLSAEVSASGLLLASSIAGVPMSSAHLLSTSIIGAGVSQRPRAVRWPLVGEIGVAWVMTIPSAAIVSYGLVRVLEVVSRVVS